MTRNISYLFALIISFMFVGCGDDDKPNRETGNYIKFSVAGPLMDGVYRIEENLDDEFSEGMVSGLVVPNGDGGNSVVLGFTDNSQKLAVSFTIPARTGLMELEEDIAMSMTITDQNQNNMGDDHTILVSKSVSLNVAEFETTSFGIFSNVKRAKGSFNGIMIYRDVVSGQEFSHTVTGDFLINKFF